MRYVRGLLVGGDFGEQLLQALHLRADLRPREQRALPRGREQHQRARPRHVCARQQAPCSGGRRGLWPGLGARHRDGEGEGERAVGRSDADAVAAGGAHRQRARSV